ncbi:MAG: TnpV protein [Ruminococcus sp.]|uniref:TnpV protein n=1 Tax=Ruminococcus sp. TaxID=41978 RepID=UPI002873D770|nr:TnpV protein [Ruminococcus sp.]MBQ3284194.1 TnpV protein [Ruminococcus sp.]
MEQKTIFEQLGGTYIRQGDYLLPNLKMPKQPEYNIGVWGQRRRRYLKQHRQIIYTNLLTSCKLSEHLAEVEKECAERMDSLVKAVAKQEGVTEALKAADQMVWVRRMNNIRNRAEEIVLKEIVYV